MMASLVAIAAMVASPADDPKGARSASASATEGWEDLTSGKGRFRVRMPANPSETKQDVATDDGPAELVILRSSAGTTAYLVTYTDVPAVAARRSKPLLDATRDLVVSSSRGRLLAERRISLGRHSGREFRAEVPLGEDAKGGILKCRIVLAGRRLYQVMAIGPRGEADSEAIEAFFRSFQPAPPR